MSRTGRFVVIGADAAGMSAASEARRVDPQLQILAFDRGGYASYSQCGMPYWLGGAVSSRERLFARSVEDFARRNIEVRLRHDVLAIDTARQVLRVRDLEAGREFDEPYDSLLVATGASPVEFPLSGRELQGVFHLDVLEDAVQIDAYLREQRPRHAVIVGGGYVGLEMAENLRRRGMQVALLQRGAQVFHSVDPELAQLLHAELERHAVEVHLGSALRAFEGHGGRVREVHTSDGVLQAELVILAAGVRPNVELTTAAGIPFGSTGALAVNARQETRAANVFAAGDCAEHYHRVLGKPAWIPLGTTANKQGRVAGRNAAGADATFGGIVATAVLKVFDVSVARTGLAEWEARAAGLDFESVLLRSTDQAGYMPDAERLTVKLVAEKRSGRLLGAQAVGRRGADKRIDVLATALYAGLSVAQLAELDLAYAPPFNSVWDPVQAAATRLLRGADRSGSAAHGEGNA